MLSYVTRRYHEYCTADTCTVLYCVVLLCSMIVQYEHTVHITTVPVLQYTATNTTIAVVE